MKKKVDEVIVRVPKTWQLKQLQERATKEFYILKLYKRTRIVLALITDLIVIIPAFHMYGHIITNNWLMLALIAGLCFLINLTMDDFLIAQCNVIIEENYLDITNDWKSGSFERLTKELEEYVKKDMSEKQIDDYILYNMSMNDEDYICHVLTFEREEK